MLIPIKHIHIPTGRQRTDLGDLEELMLSIVSIGLLNPIIVTSAPNNGYRLVAGERRLTACTGLKHEEIEATFLTSLSRKEQLVIELEENVKRKALTWQEHVKAVHTYHTLRLEQNPEHTKTETAAELNVSKAKLLKDLNLMEGVKKDPSLINVQKYSAAVTGAQKSKKRDLTLTLSDINLNTSAPSTPAYIYRADFIKWIACYEGEPFNFIHCDIPYGINLHQTGQLESVGEKYQDTKDIFYSLIEAIGKVPTTEQAHILFWTAVKNAHETKELLEGIGWKINPVPLVWLKSDGRGMAPDPRYTPKQVYEVAFLGSRGDKHLKSVFANAISLPTAGELHMSEKPKPVLHHFLSGLVDSQTIMLDPTCGSGNAVWVSKELGARVSVGIELDSKHAETASKNLGVSLC